MILSHKSCSSPISICLKQKKLYSPINNHVISFLISQYSVQTINKCKTNCKNTQITTKISSITTALLRLTPESLPLNLQSLTPETLPLNLQSLTRESLPLNLQSVMPESLPRNLESLTPESRQPGLNL